MIIGRFGATAADDADGPDLQRLRHSPSPNCMTVTWSTYLGQVPARPLVNLGDDGDSAVPVGRQQGAHVHDGLPCPAGADSFFHRVENLDPGAAGFLDSASRDLRGAQVSERDRVGTAESRPALTDTALELLDRAVTVPEVAQGARRLVGQRCLSEEEGPVWLFDAVTARSRSSSGYFRCAAMALNPPRYQSLPRFPG